MGCRMDGADRVKQEPRSRSTSPVAASASSAGPGTGSSSSASGTVSEQDLLFLLQNRPADDFLCAQNWGTLFDYRTSFLEDAESAQADLSAWQLQGQGWILKLKLDDEELRKEISHFMTELASNLSALEMNMKDEDMAEVTSWERKLHELNASMRALEKKHNYFKVIMKRFMKPQTVDTSSDIDAFTPAGQKERPLPPPPPKVAPPPPKVPPVQTADLPVQPAASGRGVYRTLPSWVTQVENARNPAMNPPPAAAAAADPVAAGPPPADHYAAPSRGHAESAAWRWLTR